MSSLARVLLALSLTSAVAVVPTAADAGEYLQCEGKKDGTKCNKRYEKWLKKEKARTTPLKPSQLNERLEPWDADDKNPFATADWYAGSRAIGLDSVDELLGEVTKAQALVKMAKYVGYLHKSGDKEQAKELAGIILPDLIALKEIVPTLQEKLQAVQADLPNIAKESPTLILPAGKALTQTVGHLGKIPGDIPGALAAVVPLAKGAPAAAKTMAVDAVNDKVTGGGAKKTGKRR